MNSELSQSEFTIRLKENTKIVDPKIFGTPFVIFTIFSGQTRKRFCGEFSKTKFRLTKNSVLFPTPYIIEGKLKPTSNNKTRISFKIKPIWFGYLWIRIMPVLALILINTMLLIQTKPVETEVYVLLNIVLISMFLPILITRNIKKRLLKDFYKIFEIIK